MKRQTTTRLYKLRDACHYAHVTIRREYPNITESHQDQENIQIIDQMLVGLRIAIDKAQRDEAIMPDGREA